MKRLVARCGVPAGLLVALTAADGRAEDLVNRAFRIQHDARGLTSLKRTGDVYDTEYIAPNASLGRLLIPFRTTPNGDWRELRDLLEQASSGQRVDYAFGSRLPAARGVGGLRALNDNIVPAAAGRGSAAGSEAQAIPLFVFPTGDVEPGTGGTTREGTTRWLFCGALRTHATIVTRDPVFGEFAYGGLLTRIADSIDVVPRDGLRVRFHIVRDRERLHMVLDHDGYAKDQPIVVRDGLASIQFTLENRTGGPHTTTLTVSGLPGGEYDVSVDGTHVLFARGGAEASTLPLPVGRAATACVVISRKE